MVSVNLYSENSEELEKFLSSFFNSIGKFIVVLLTSDILYRL